MSNFQKISFIITNLEKKLHVCEMTISTVKTLLLRFFMGMAPLDVLIKKPACFYNFANVELPMGGHVEI